MQTNVSDFGLPNTQRQSCNHTLSRTGPGQIRLKLYTLFRTEGPKTIPYPAARPRVAHIGEYPPPGPSYTCQLSDIMCESHACGLKTSISRIKVNFSCLTIQIQMNCSKKPHFISDLLCIISFLFITIHLNRKSSKVVGISSDIF